MEYCSLLNISLTKYYTYLTKYSLKLSMADILPVNLTIVMEKTYIFCPYTNSTALAI
jgi:hypothetical protein